MASKISEGVMHDQGLEWDGIVERIKEARKIIGATQSEFSQLIGVSQSHISEIERGNSKPSVEIIKKISDKVPNVTMDWLFFGAGHPEELTDEYFEQISFVGDHDPVNLTNIEMCIESLHIFDKLYEGPVNTEMRTKVFKSLMRYLKQMIYKAGALSQNFDLYNAGKQLNKKAVEYARNSGSL
ncbi:hypothetical protein AD949_00810 [Acetobacter orleanensis]|nr:hypothetical protein AD949_00810 [Acetobacter orleanensis]PCD78306.1 transcriptional regulator [Acetobacter orleanensis]